VSDEHWDHWTPEDDAEFAQAELDDAAASQAAEDQFPAGWTEVGATDESVAEFVADQLRTGPGLKSLMATFLGLQAATVPDPSAPERSPIFEAIDRASSDRTVTIDITPDTGKFDQMLELMKTAAGAMEQFTRAARSVALMGTGYRRHASPGKQRSGETRAEHARRRRLYSARLQRDRRRRRAGRAPILRSSAFQALIPRAQVDVRRAGPELAGMEVMLSVMVPDDQVFIVDNSVLQHQPFVEPHELRFSRDQAAWRRELLYGMHDASLTGRTHRATNFLIQADNAMRQNLGLPVIESAERGTGERRGYRPSRVWVDDVEVDVDTWMNEGGADRG